MNTIDVQVETEFLGEKLSPTNQTLYAFSYTVHITNNGEFPMTLRSRYWRITNGNGETSDVSGDGVVGEQPTILPQETYTYTSMSFLETQVGTMEGFYDFECLHTPAYRANIPLFRLSATNILH